MVVDGGGAAGHSLDPGVGDGDGDGDGARSSYHPAIVAQAAATLAEVFPGRLWCAFGTEPVPERAGLITVQINPDQQREIVHAFREGGGEGKPLYPQVHVAYAPTEAQARQAAFDHCKTNVYPSQLITSGKTPCQFDALPSKVWPADLDGSVRISADLRRHAAWLQEDLASGSEHIYLHEAGLQQDRFIDAFAAHVLPPLRT